MSKVKTIARQDSDIAYVGSEFTGLTGGNEASIENIIYFGYNMLFGNVSKLANEAGGNARYLVEGTDYNYDERLDDAAGDGVDIYDDDISGLLTGMFRVVENSKNITDPTGLNLKVIAKDLQIADGPLADECFIDPEHARVKLPEPIFWHACESLTSFNIKTADTPISTNFVLSTDKKFGTYGLYNRNTIHGTGLFRPFGNTVKDLQRGTISCWVENGLESGGAVGYLHFGFAQTVFHLYLVNNNNTCRQELYINNTLISTSYVNIGTYPNFYHIYMVWDYAKGLTDGKSIRIFIQGTEVLSSTNTLPVMVNPLSFTSESGAVGVQSFIDNIKIWNHVVSEDPSFEYNSGAGRVDAMHVIYGATNEYKPLTPQVGYFYMTANTTPLVLNGAGHAENLANFHSYNKGIGQIHTKLSPLRTNAYVKLAPATNFVYDLDMSSICDLTTTGSFSSTVLPSNKYFRIVEHEVNMLHAAGGNLIPIAKDLSIASNLTETPNGTDIWVDPLLGLVSVPRPMYFSKCETLANLTTTPEFGIAPTISYTGTAGTWNVATGQFGSGLVYTNALTTETEATIDFNFKASNKMTFSFWVKMASIAKESQLFIGVKDLLEIKISKIIAAFNHNILIGGTEVETSVTTDLSTFAHVYIVIDNTAGLTDSKTVRIFINGSEVLSTITSFSSLTAQNFKMRLVKPTGTNGFELLFDNLKIWNHVVTQDPSWEYNSGTGRENALHIAYASSNGYVPDFVTNSGIGNYHVDGDKNYVKWSI